MTDGDIVLNGRYSFDRIAIKRWGVTSDVRTRSGIIPSNGMTIFSAGATPVSGLHRPAKATGRVANRRVGTRLLPSLSWPAAGWSAPQEDWGRWGRRRWCVVFVVSDACPEALDRERLLRTARTDPIQKRACPRIHEVVGHADHRR